MDLGTQLKEEIVCSLKAPRRVGNKRRLKINLSQKIILK